MNIRRILISLLNPYEQLDESQQKFIIGVRANVWTEHYAESYWREKAR